jgi:hypothetical protein
VLAWIIHEAEFVSLMNKGELDFGPLKLVMQAVSDFFGVFIGLSANETGPGAREKKKWCRRGMLATQRTGDGHTLWHNEAVLALPPCLAPEFRGFWSGEVRKIPLPRTLVSRARRRAGASFRDKPSRASCFFLLCV